MAFLHIFQPPPLPPWSGAGILLKKKKKNLSESPRLVVVVVVVFFSLKTPRLNVHPRQPRSAWRGFGDAAVGKAWKTHPRPTKRRLDSRRHLCGPSALPLEGGGGAAVKHANVFDPYPKSKFTRRQV